MQVEIFTLCDAATVPEGKLNVLGTFDTLSFPKFPHYYDLFMIATRVRFAPDENGIHQMHVRWIDSDGAIVEASDDCKIEIDFIVGRDTTHHIWHYHGKEFYGPDDYLLQLVIDDTPVCTIPLTIKQRK